MIIPMFQPIHSTKSGVVVGAEVLNRWLFDEVYYAPGDVRVGIRWEDIDPEVILLLIKNIPAIEARYPRLMINVLEETLESDYRFAAWIAQVERFRALTTVELIIEMTEGVTDASLWKRWDELKAKGIPLVMDDYGYKNSTHERLEAFLWDGCKFDVKRLAALAQKDMKGVRFCQDSDIPLIGEQVETEQLAQQSSWMGVHLQQGYHHGRPALLDGWVKKEKKKAVAK